MITQLSGICGNEPDYALIIVDATQGLTATGKEYIKMATTMQVPFIIVITKADMAEEMQLLLTRYDVRTIMRYKACFQTLLLRNTAFHSKDLTM